jgi:hypothetical protein
MAASLVIITSLVCTPASLIVIVAAAPVAVVVMATASATLSATPAWVLAVVVPGATRVTLLIVLVLVAVVVLGTPSAIVAVGVTTAVARLRRRLGRIGRRRLKSSLRIRFASLVDFGEVDRGLVAGPGRVLLLASGVGCAVHHGLPVDLLSLGWCIATGGGLSRGWWLGRGRSLRLCRRLRARLIDRLALVRFLVWFLSHLCLGVLFDIVGACRVLLPFFLGSSFS